VTSCTIRRAGPADAEALAAFGERTFRDTYGPANTQANTDTYVRGAYGAAIQRAELSDPLVSTLVAVDPEGALAAFAQLRAAGKSPAPAGDAPIEIWRFYVDRAWHGQGLASQLMATVRDTARNLGKRTIWLVVWQQNARAIAFYTREGFQVVGTQPFQYGDDVQTDLIMQSTLTLPES
jgi:ribosomal protein S18 acetylase RimI-like enzyme